MNSSEREAQEKLREQQRAWQAHWNHHVARDGMDALARSMLGSEWAAISTSQAIELRTLSPTALERVRAALATHDLLADTSRPDAEIDGAVEMIEVADGELFDSHRMWLYRLQGGFIAREEFWLGWRGGFMRAHDEEPRDEGADL